jgi:hypothetical protein
MIQNIRLRHLMAAALAVAASACSSPDDSMTGPSNTSPGDQYVLLFDSTITTDVMVSGATVTTSSTVHGQVALASTPQANQFGESSGDLTYLNFSYTFSPTGPCTFSTSTTNGAITVVEASVSPANANAIRVLLRPSNTVRESIVQSCPTQTFTTPGIFWFGGWQVLHANEADTSMNAWVIDDWSPGSGNVAATTSYTRSLDTPEGVTYEETTTLAIQKVN